MEKSFKAETRQGRPTAPLHERLSKVLNQSLPEALEGWPNLQTPCWDGPRLIHHEGRMRPLRRVILETMLELHPTHRLRPTCANPRTCRNPHHVEIVLINRRDGTPVEPLPPEAFGQFVAKQDAQTHADEIEDCADWIISFDDGRATPPDQLYDRCGGLYDLPTIQAALIRARDL